MNVLLPATMNGGVKRFRDLPVKTAAEKVQRTIQSRSYGAAPAGRRGFVRQIFVVGCIAIWAQLAGGQAQAQNNRSTSEPTLPSDSRSKLETVTQEEVADESVATKAVPAWQLPPQPYMREVKWRDVMGKDFPADTPPFFRDSLLQIVTRSYYLTRNNSDNSRSQAWAGGGWLAYRSGLIADLFGVHAALYTSQRLFGPSDESGSKLLNPEQNPINVFGQGYGFVRIYDQELRGGRQLVDTPLINPQDNRMVPNTFEGVQLVSLPDKSRSYDYAAGYLWNIKQRDSNDFISMSDALTGANVDNRGAPYGMVRLRPIPGFTGTLMDYYVEDFINTGFAQAEYTFQLPKDVPQWTVGANIIDQRTVGADLLTGTSFQTYQASGKVQAAYAGWTFFVAGSVTGDSSKIYSPYGSKPNYTDMQQASFDNPSEKAIGGSLAYDFGYAFGRIGFSGLSVGTWYTHGWGAMTPGTNLGIPDRDELDLWVQYRPTEGSLKGFRAKVQYGDVWQQGNMRDDQPEFRFILDYTVLFRS